MRKLSIDQLLHLLVDGRTPKDFREKGEEIHNNSIEPALVPYPDDDTPMLAALI
jgi:hypothetical protein